MAKKTAKRNGINLSQEVNKLLSGNRKISIGDIVAKIKAKHPKANEGSIKTSFYKNPKRAGARRRRKAEPTVTPRVKKNASNQVVTIEHLKAAKKLVENVGGTNRALAAVKAYAELVTPS